MTFNYYWDIEIIPSDGHGVPFLAFSKLDGVPYDSGTPSAEQTHGKMWNEKAEMCKAIANMYNHGFIRYYQLVRVFQASNGDWIKADTSCSNFNLDDLSRQLETLYKYLLSKDERR